MHLRTRALLATAIVTAATQAAAENDPRPGLSAHLDRKIREAPIARALANLQDSPATMTAAEQARARGRMRLLSYMRMPGAADLPDEAALWRDARDRKLPRMPDDPDLLEAVKSYTIARDLEPENLRTRSALAFALDRLGRTALARQELRFAADLALAKVRAAAAAGAPLEGEIAILVEELSAHLEQIAQSDEELDRAAELRGISVLSRIEVVTPILVPLVDGLEAGDHIDPASRVRFDFSGQGHAIRAGWIKPTAAWLVWDPASRQRITSGFQLFGSVTWVAHWDNGYRPLSLLDNDGDGVIRGAELTGLSLWTDANQNGRSDRGEVRTLAESGVTALSYAHGQIAPGVWEAPAGVTFSDGTTRPTYDWTFRSEVKTAAR